MKLHIKPTNLISEVQHEFNSFFPFLKLEFYQKHVTGRPDFGPGAIMLHNRKIGDCQTAMTDGILDINKEMKVSELEKQLKDSFHLQAQLFRRSGNIWLQTTITDDWTLEKQNEHGMEISRSTRPPLIPDEVTDLDNQ